MVVGLGGRQLLLLLLHALDARANISALAKRQTRLPPGMVARRHLHLRAPSAGAVGATELGQPNERRFSGSGRLPLSLGDRTAGNSARLRQVCGAARGIAAAAATRRQ